MNTQANLENQASPFSYNDQMHINFSPYCLGNLIQSFCTCTVDERMFNSLNAASIDIFRQIENVYDHFPRKKVDGKLSRTHSSTVYSRYGWRDAPKQVG